MAKVEALRKGRLLQQRQPAAAAAARRCDTVAVKPRVRRAARSEAVLLAQNEKRSASHRAAVKPRARRRAARSEAVVLAQTGKRSASHRAADSTLPSSWILRQ